MMPDGEPSRALAVAVCLLLVAVAPSVMGGDAADPEVTDTCESQESTDEDINITDVQKAWLDPISWEIFIKMCNDPDTQEFRRQAQSAWTGWRFLWTDTDEVRWEVRAWVEESNLLNTRYFEHTCKKLPGQAWEDAGGDHGENNPGHDTPDPARDGHPDTLVLSVGPLAREAERMEKIHVLAGQFNRTTDGERDCETGWLTTGDRAPDMGEGQSGDYGRPIVLVEPVVEREMGVVVKALRSDASATLGGVANWTIDIGNVAEELRNVTLSVRSDSPVDPRIDDPYVLVEERENATRNITATVPADMELGTVPVTLQANISSEEVDEKLGSLQIDLDLTAIGYRPDLTAEETVRTTNPGNGTEFALQVHNRGTAVGRYNLSVEGPTSQWASFEDRTVSADPGAAAETGLAVTVPNGTAVGAYDLTVVAEAVGTGESASLDVRVAVMETATIPTSYGELPALPGPGAAAAAAGLVAVALTLRRRRRR